MPYFLAQISEYQAKCFLAPSCAMGAGCVPKFSNKRLCLSGLKWWPGQLAPPVHNGYLVGGRPRYIRFVGGHLLIYDKFRRLQHLIIATAKRSLVPITPFQVLGAKLVDHAPHSLGIVPIPIMRLKTGVYVDNQLVTKLGATSLTGPYGCSSCHGRPSVATVFRDEVAAGNAQVPGR
jgi:hypothetical protein